jgi:hypothetical protein
VCAQVWTDSSEGVKRVLCSHWTSSPQRQSRSRVVARPKTLFGGQEALFELVGGSKRYMSRVGDDRTKYQVDYWRDYKPVESPKKEPMDIASLEPAMDLEVGPGTTKPAQRCKGLGWQTSSQKIVCQLMQWCGMRKNANHLPVKFPFCGSFKNREGYDQLEICMAIEANGQSVDFVVRSKECHLEFHKEKTTRHKHFACRVENWLKSFLSRSDDNHIR